MGSGTVAGGPGMAVAGGPGMAVAGGRGMAVAGGPGMSQVQNELLQLFLWHGGCTAHPGAFTCELPLAAL